MALAKWARMEEPTPGLLKTRREVDEWILPNISRYDTLYTVLGRYAFFLVYIYRCALGHIQILLLYNDLESSY